MDLYGPDAPWPSHPEPFYHSGLDYAQEAGWYLQKFDGHTWGKLVCKEDAPRDERCNIGIMRTARGGETFALSIRAKIDSCPHHDRRKTPSRFERTEQASERLDEAERLVGAARLCIDSHSKTLGAKELLQLAIQAVQDADEVLGEEEALVNEAGELEGEAETDRANAASLAETAGYPSDAPVAAAPLLDEATDRVRQASTSVRGRRDGRSTRLQQRIQAIRATIRSLRTQLPS